MDIHRTKMNDFTAVHSYVVYYCMQSIIFLRSISSRCNVNNWATSMSLRACRSTTTHNQTITYRYIYISRLSLQTAPTKGIFDLGSRCIMFIYCPGTRQPMDRTKMNDFTHVQSYVVYY